MISFIHDINFYQILLKSLQYSANYKVFPVYISAASNNYMGSISAIANPYIMFYIPMCLYNCTKNISLSFNIFFIIINVLQFVCMYICLCGITKKKISALFCSLLYVSFYIITLNSFIRVGLSEHIAITFIPLVIYGFYNIYFEDGKYKLLLLLGLFLIAESNVTIFLLTLTFVILCCAIFFIKSIFKMKIVNIILMLVLLFLLIAWTYVPMVHCYILKQYRIVDVLGNTNVIFTSFLCCIIVSIYILICKYLVVKLENKIFKIGFVTTVCILFVSSISIYSYYYINTDHMTINEVDNTMDEVYIPKIDESYYENNKQYFDEVYKDCSFSPFDIRVYDYSNNYLFMDINYNISPYVDKCILDVPFYNMIGFKAYDEDGTSIPILYNEEGLCRVVLSKKEGSFKIGFSPLPLWMFSLVVSTLALFALVFIRIFKEIHDFRAYLRENRLENDKKI